MKNILLLLCLVPFFSRGQIITTVAGNGTSGFTGDGGPATAAQLSRPFSVAVDKTGNVYIADFFIRKINTSGIINTIAGTTGMGFGGDGGQATLAQFYGIYCVIVDTSGNLYVSDSYNNRVRKITTDGIVNTIAGSGATGVWGGGYSGDGGQATNARLHEPQGLAIDNSGNLYIADMGNSCIRKVTPSGIITTFAGTTDTGYAGDGGPATAAVLYCASDLATDANGNVYIGDFHNQCVRKVDRFGIITTVAGKGGSSNCGYSGDGGPATDALLCLPAGMALDLEGDLYIAATNDYSIRKVDRSGIITLAAGNGRYGFSGDGGPATLAELDYCRSVAFNSEGDLYIADGLNSRIRKVSKLVTATKQISNNISFSISPNPSRGKFTLTLSSPNNEQAQLTITNLPGEKVKEQTIVSNKETEIQLQVPAGVYFVTAVTSIGRISERIVVE